MELTSETQEYIKQQCERYEEKRSAILPCLYRIQKENGGWVSGSAIKALAQAMDVPVVQVAEVVEFYTMYNKKPVGRFHIQVCCNISCSMAGAQNIAQKLKAQLGVDFDEATADGEFTISRVECLGSCDTAPVIQVNDRYYENLNESSALGLIEGLRGSHGN